MSNLQSFNCVLDSARTALIPYDLFFWILAICVLVREDYKNLS